MNELDFYNKVKNWDFSMINCKKEYLTNWDMYKILNEYATSESRILDLGTGGGEKVLEYFPKCKEIMATDFSAEMISTAKANLKITNKNYITFKQMDNLNMTTKDNYFDIVTARHTCTDSVQIYKTLKSGGKLIIRGNENIIIFLI